METVTISLEEYRHLLLANQSLRNEVEYLKERIDRGISNIAMDIQCLKENMK